MKRIFAHRGVSSLAPENTMAAFKEITKVKTNWIETDVSITKDGHVFMLHDDQLDRTTNLDGEITSMMSSKVLSADAGSWYDKNFSNEKVPTLEEFIEFVSKNNLNVNIELKSVTGENANELADKLCEILANEITQIQDKSEIIISSFNPIMLEKFYKLKPELKYSYLFRREDFRADWNLLMQATHASSVHIDEKGLTKEKIHLIKKFGYSVNVYTVDKKDRANQLFNWGADGIFTNKAQLFE